MRLHPLIRAAGALKIAEAITPKTAGAESLLRSVGMVTDDVGMLALRKYMGAGEQALRVPQLAERAHHIHNPEYEASPEIAAVRNILRFSGKMAAVSMQVPQAPETTTGWERDPKRVSQAFESMGAASKMSLPDQPNIGTGDFAKSADQDALAETPYMENEMMRRLQTTAGTGSLTPSDSVNEAFNKLRMFMNQDSLAMNTMGQEAEIPNAS